MSTIVSAHITGTVWKIEVKVGDRVSPGQTLIVLESMKMEIPIDSEREGKVANIFCKESEAVKEGQALMEIE